MAPGVTKHMCVTLGMKFVFILAKGSQNMGSKGCVYETDRQTDTAGIESQVCHAGRSWQGSASTWPQFLHLQHGVGVLLGPHSSRAKLGRLNSGGLSMLNILYRHRLAELSVMLE